MTFNMSEQIGEIVKYNYNLRVRLAGVSDLIASETKYHWACFSALKTLSEKAKQDTNDTDLALVWLCQELEYAADKGHVINFSDAWNRYIIIIIHFKNLTCIALQYYIKRVVFNLVSNLGKI